MWLYMGGIHYISLRGGLIMRVASKWLWFFNYQGLLFALLDWYTQTLRFSCNNIVIMYEEIHYDSLYRVVTIEKINNWLWLFNHQEVPFALLDWYNQTLRFSCNNIVIIYEGIHYKGCWYWKKLKPAIWDIHHINLLDWYNQTLRFSCNNIEIIYEGCQYWKI